MYLLKKVLPKYLILIKDSNNCFAKYYTIPTLYIFYFFLFE